MKFLVVFAMALAVSQAAFSGSLVRQAQPALDSIKSEFSLNIKARSAAEVGLQTQIGQAINDQVTQILQTIESVIEGAQSTLGDAAGQIMQAVSQIQSAVQGGQSGVQQIVAGLLQNLQTTFGSLFGGLLGGNSRGLQLTPALISTISGLLRPHMALINAEPVFACVNAAWPGGLSLQTAVDLQAQGSLNLQEVINHPLVKPCLRAQGGAIAALKKSVLVKKAYRLVVRLGLRNKVIALMNKYIGAADTAEIVAALDTTNVARSDFELTPELIELAFTMVAQYQDDIHAEPMYQCLNSGMPGGLNAETLLALYQNGGLTIDSALANPVVVNCLAVNGGLAGALASSPLVQRIRAFVVSLGLQDTIIEMLPSIVGSSHAETLIAALGLSSRGLLDNIPASLQGLVQHLIGSIDLHDILLNVLTNILGAEQAQAILTQLQLGNRGFFGSVWGAIQGQASSIGQAIAVMASQTWDNIKEKFEMIKMIAQSFLAGGLQQAQNWGLQQAQNLIDQMQPHVDDLGELYHNTVAQLQQIYQGLVVPSRG